MKLNDPKISVVVPCYNEANGISLIVSELFEVLKDFRFEIILVDDGSVDHSPLVYEMVSEEYENVKYIRLSRNFGHQHALRAGIDYAGGDAIIIMDADLQHPPQLLPEMIDKWLHGAIIVEAVAEKKKTPNVIKHVLSFLFYRMIKWLADHPIVEGANDFRLMDKKVACYIKKSTENSLYLRGVCAWVGFKKAIIYYQQPERAIGKTKYSFKKMVSLAIQGLTSSTVKPLRLALLFGLLFSILGFGFIIYVLYVVLFTETAVSGWASVVVSVLFFSGLQMMILGVLGEYLGKLFMENKRRPGYFIEKSNIDLKRTYA